MKTSRKLLQTFRNQLLASTFGGIVTGFVLALYLGAFSSKDYENVTDWLAVLVASVAAGISLYAVRLVAHTLKATQDTLAATVQMANDQRRIGNAQIRPWVLAYEYAIIVNEWSEEIIEIKLKNFGHTPARLIHTLSSVTYFTSAGDNPSVDRHVYHSELREYLAPSEVMLLRRTASHALDSILNHGQLTIDIDYYDIDRKSDVKGKPWRYKAVFQVYRDVRGPRIEIQ